MQEDGDDWGMTLNLRRLIQIMGMTGSASDGEALNAVRKANEMLRSAGKTWADVLKEPSTSFTKPSTPDYRTPPSKRKPGAAYGQTVRREKHSTRNRGRHADDDIQVMLSAVAARRNTMNTMMFLASLNDHWERMGYLTTPQYEALKQMHAGRF